MRLICALMLLASFPAAAGDVLFLSEPSPEMGGLVLAAESGERITSMELMDQTAAWTDADAQAQSALAAALADARTYETRLDGELLIMQQLALPIAQISALRGEEDRRDLFAALAYQGFAVDRFFEEDLGKDDRAADFRYTIDQRLVPSPWADAVALEPEMAVTPYQIADATVRARYEEIRTHINTALPALLAPQIPDGVTLVVDGRKTDVGVAGTTKLAPGRHLVHAEANGVIIQRWTFEVGPTERVDLVLDNDPKAVDDWLASFSGSPSAAPPAVAKNIAVRGGLLIVEPSSDSAWRIDASGTATAEALPKPEKPGRDVGTATTGVSVDVALGGGWLGSPDFYFQDPTAADATFATVNAPSLGLGLGLSYDIGALRLVGGMDLLMPLGGAHVARTGESNMPIRPTPLLGAGLRQAQAVVGYVLPYHLAVGGRLSLPLTSGLELRGTALAGLPGKRTLSDGTAWEGHVLGTAWLGVGWRFGG